MTKNYQITYKTGTLVIKGKIYTVTYEKGSNVSTIGKTSDTCTTSGTSTSCSVTLPNITTNTGYTASGWYNGTTKAGNAGASYTISGNTTLTAKATANTYSIGYTLNGGSYGTSHPTSGTYDSNINISNPKKTITITGNANSTGATVGSATSKAQTFAGWTADSNLSTSTAKYGTSTSVTNSWSSASTKVTAEYFKNLRTTSGTVTLTANWTPVAFNTPTITKTGYKCGWATSSSATSYTIASGGTYTPTATTGASVTLYGVCTANNYDVNLSIVNGTTTGDKTKKVSYNNTTTFTGLSANTGYGTPTVSCTNGQTATISGSTVTTGKITSGTTCTVTYAVNTYQVKYNANGGTAETKEEFVDIFSGATITSDQEGYWEYNPTYNALQLGGQPSPEYAVIRTTEFEITDENSLLTFHAELSQGSLNYNLYNSNNEIVDSGSDDANTFENPITISSYHDKGKYTLEIELQTEGTAKVGNFTIEAPSSMSNSKHTYDTAKSLTKNIYTRKGYIFLGWSKDKNATTATYTDEESVKNLTGTNNETVNLYAIWKLKSKKITFETKYDTSSFSGPSTSNQTSEKISKTSTNLSYGSSEVIKVNPATPTDRYSVRASCTNNIIAVARNIASSGGGSSTSEYSYSIEVMNNSDTTTDSVCTITYTPKWEGVATGTYTAGATMTYAGKSWTVKSDNGEDIGLVLNETAGSGVYKANVQSELNNAKVNTDVSGGGILPQSSNVYVTTDGGINTNYSSFNQLFWIGNGKAITPTEIKKYTLGSDVHYSAGHRNQQQDGDVSTTTYWTSVSFPVSVTSAVAYSAGSTISATATNSSITFSDANATSTSQGKMGDRYMAFQPQKNSSHKPSSSSMPVRRWTYDYATQTYPTEASYITQKTLKLYDCGNAQHGKAFTLTAVSSTEYKSTSQTGTTNTPKYATSNTTGYRWYWASSVDGTVSNSVRTYRFDTSPRCLERTKYSTSDVTKNIYYRPYLIVRER